MSGLPSEFTSLYRLFLRTAAASVLHQPQATKSLRKLWRPVFEDAARVTTRLQADALSAAYRNDLEIWLQTWHLRVDNTLVLLYNSCTTRGLSHQLTRNLSFLLQREQDRINKRKPREWKPDSLPTTKVLKVEQRQQREAAHGWDALEEVVRMAEGRNELSLGKMTLKRILRRNLVTN
ncbi:hypothetical protein C8R43DRAFT_644917 [Mycena crocata]|nr:hypothetical protein C8R43DRAFT_644917 [Mycena crocata]